MGYRGTRLNRIEEEDLTLNKASYLALALQHRAYVKYEWLLGMFALMTTPPKNTEVKYHLKLIEGQHYYWDGSEYQRITDAVDNTPLFYPDEPVTLPAGCLENLKESVDTTAFRATINAYCLAYPVGDLIPYINRRIKVREIENRLNELMVDAPGPGIRVPGKCTPEQLVLAQRGIETLGKLSSVIVYSSSEKSLLAAPGIEEFKKQLLAEFKAAGKDINDGLVAHEFQERLTAYDFEFLKNDPCFKNGIGRKAAKARLKINGAYGKEAGFGGNDFNPTVTRALKEGITQTSEEFTAGVNSTRAGSFKRGNETQNGGVLSTLFARLLFDMPISKIACKTEEYRRVRITEINSKFVGRYDRHLTRIDEAYLQSNLNKEIEIRSPLHCRNETFCHICAGERVSNGGKTPQMFATAISATVLSSSMAAFHGLTLSAVTTNLDEVIS